MGVPGILFHFKWVPSIPCIPLFTVPASPSVDLTLSAVSKPLPPPFCCCCERLFAFSVHSPLCLFGFGFVFCLIFCSIFALRLVRTLPFALPHFLTFLLRC
uniref:Uncharacterized protein n=1 Tax=Mus musculus TaxID=10090 RepID=Q9D3N9_MOUSE|nr:unnamed protein product [Mus musculus]